LLERDIPKLHTFRLWGTAVCDPPAFAAFGVKIIGWWGMTETITHGIIGEIDQPNMPMAIGRSAAEYAIRVTAGTGSRPTSIEAKRIERSVTVATVIELIASFALPFVVIAAGRSDWVLPSIAITIGPLLLWLGHLVAIPRYRPVGWALTVGPFILVAAMSGNALAATTGIAAGILLLGTATAGFHDLAAIRAARNADQTPHTTGSDRLLDLTP